MGGGDTRESLSFVQVCRGDIVTVILHVPTVVFDPDGGADGNMRRVVWAGHAQSVTFHPRVKPTAALAEHDCYADVLCGTQVWPTTRALSCPASVAALPALASMWGHSTLVSTLQNAVCW